MSAVFRSSTLGAGPKIENWPAGNGAPPEPKLASETDLSEEVRATLAFAGLEGIGQATLRALKVAFGTLSQALRAPRASVLPHLRGEATRRRFLELKQPEALVDRILERLHSMGARAMLSTDPCWPRQLRGVGAPLLLFVRGVLSGQMPRLSIVGARRADDYGVSLTRFFASNVAAKGGCIVSGGAVGIDTAAHLAALESGGATVAVLGTGIDVAYPPSNAGLFQDIVRSGGAVLSQFPPGTPAIRQNFCIRNKLIAALADATLVTRASMDSGALSTAQAAHALGRPLFAVPGALDCTLSWGTTQLIETGLARAVSGVSPIGDILGLRGPWPRLFDAPAIARRCSTASALPRPERQEPLLPPPDLEPKMLNVFNELQHSPLQFDELLPQSDLDATGLADALLHLELLGLCEELPGRRFVRRHAGREQAP